MKKSVFGLLGLYLAVACQPANLASHEKNIPPRPYFSVKEYAYDVAQLDNGDKEMNGTRFEVKVYPNGKVTCKAILPDKTVVTRELDVLTRNGNWLESFEYKNFMIEFDYEPDDRWIEVEIQNMSTEIEFWQQYIDVADLVEHTVVREGHTEK